MSFLNYILQNVYNAKFNISNKIADYISFTREQIIIFFIFGILTLGACYFQIVTVWHHHLDAAFLIETLQSIKKTGIPITYLGPAVIDVFNSGIISSNAEFVCKSDLIPSGIGLSVLDSHAYLILYPLAMISWLFPPHIVIAVANGFSFASFIFILYWILRGMRVSIIGSILFCSLVMVHPAWSFSFLGDFYADRFFMPLGLLYIFLLYDTTSHKFSFRWNYLCLTLLVGLFAAITTERAAIMIALFTIAFLFLYRKRINSSKLMIILCVFSMVLLMYVLLYLKLFFVHHAGTGSLFSLFQGITQFFDLIHDPIYAGKVREFVVINVLFLGIFSLFEWRLSLIAFATLLPNLLTTIGGAEKTGWATHYHSMYFPFLVFASAIGFSKLWIYLGTTKYRLILIGLLLILIPVIAHYSIGYGSQMGGVTRLYNFYTNIHYSEEKRVSGLLKQISDTVPVGARVTTTEGMMPALYNGRVISYYPIGIDAADYAVLSRVTNKDGTFFYVGAPSYIVGEAQKIDLCLTDRLKRVGYNVDEPLLFPGDIAVLKRSNGRAH